MTEPEISAGTVFDDRFRVVRRIAQGGQGDVYAVEDLTDGNAERALKTLRPNFLPHHLDRLQREVEAIRSLKLPGVVSLMATNLTSDPRPTTPYYVMPFAKHDTLRHHDYFTGEIDLSLRLFRPLCVTMAAVHATGILHRDLKPGNILLVDSEKDLQVADFGLCYLELENDADRATKIREKVGPMFFAAPEQTSLPPHYSRRGDIYSLGRILHFMISGVYEILPTSDYTPVSTGAESAGQLTPTDRLIQRMTAFDPKNRPETLDAVVSEIDQLLGATAAAPSLKLTRVHHRIMKYLGSDFGSDVDLSEILEYMANFYDIEREPKWIDQFQQFSVKISWSRFAATIETALDQLVEVELLRFHRGGYARVDVLKKAGAI